jgi:integrase
MKARLALPKQAKIPLRVREAAVFLGVSPRRRCIFGLSESRFPISARWVATSDFSNRSWSPSARSSNRSKIWWMRYRDKDGVRQRESTLAEDWDEAQKRLRERLQARDNNTLPALRRGQDLTFGEWSDFYLENFSRPPFRAQKTHEVNQRALKHLRKMFENTKLAELTADDIEMYLRGRLKQGAGEDEGRIRREASAEGNDSAPGITSDAAHVERGRAQEVPVCESMRGRRVSGAGRWLFRPHYVTSSEHQKIEFAAPEYLRNVIRIVTETGLRIYKELTPMKKDQLDLVNRTVWIPDSKTPNGVAEVPLTDIAADAFRSQLAISGPGPYLFPSDENASGHQKTFKTAWHAALRRAKVTYFRIYDLRSTYATRLSAGGVADEWVTQLLRQGDAKVFKKYSQMKLQMKREALAKPNRQANETGPGFGTAQGPAEPDFGTVEAKEQRKRWKPDQ